MDVSVNLGGVLYDGMLHFDGAWGFGCKIGRQLTLPIRRHSPPFPEENRLLYIPQLDTAMPRGLRLMAHAAAQQPSTSTKRLSPESSDFQETARKRLLAG